MKHHLTYGEIPVLALDDIKACFDYQCGISIYRGVLVAWDEDYDTRIFVFLDTLPTRLRKRLIAVGERKGMLCCLWRRVVIPEGYEVGKQFIVDAEGCGDCWTIEQSETMAVFEEVTP